MPQPSSISLREPVYNVPIALDDSLSYVRGFVPEEVKSRIGDHAIDVREYTLGPIPIRKFLDEFLPSTTSNVRGMLSSKGAFRRVPTDESTSADVHDALMHSLNQATKNKSRCPGFTFADMPCRPIYTKYGIHKRFIAYYASKNVPAPSPAEEAPSNELGHAEFFIDIHPNPAFDFFADPEHGADEPTCAAHCFFASPEDEKTKKRVDRTLGQHVDHVSELLARQHRTFVFSISVFGTTARLIRWDRAGAVVSEAFDVDQHPELLCDFLWRFSQTSHAGRGHDTTVERATPEEERLFKEAITRRVQHELDVDGEELEKMVSKHYAPGEAIALHVASECSSAAPRRFIVSRPVISPTLSIGKCTRGFWALDTLTGLVVFVKDTWRSAYLVENEGSILLGLTEDEVRNIPNVVCHGDVPHSSGQSDAQQTVSDRYRDEKWVCRGSAPKLSVRPHVHYRLVLGVVGYNLNDLRGSEELLQATYDAYQAMLDAYKKSSRIHRDISVGNVLLVKDPGRTVRRGVLIDWEVSSTVGADGCSLDMARTGTWSFMSCKLLELERSHHTFQDDMESMMYVVFYAAIRWLPHSQNMYTVERTLFAFFDARRTVQGREVGGSQKQINSQNRGIIRTINFRTPVELWLRKVMDYHSPPAPLASRYADRWSNPSHLDTFWRHFLRDITLPRADRVNRRVRGRTCISAETSPPYPEPSPSVGKRTREAEPEQRRQRTKRAKNTSPSGMTTRRRPVMAIPPSQPRSSRPIRLTRQSAAQVGADRARQVQGSGQRRYNLRSAVVQTIA